MTPIVSKGMKITCENGHYIGEVLKDLYAGDIGWGDAFGNWAAGVVMNVGQTEKPKCPECGAKFISDAYWSFHYEDGSWRP